MKAIVTIVISSIPKGLPKEAGIDIFGRYSTDRNSKHKSKYIEVHSINEQSLVDKIKVAEESVILNLEEDGIEARISRTEVIEE